MSQSSHEDHELSDILDQSLSEGTTNRTRKIFAGLKENFHAFQHEGEALVSVLEKSPTLQQKQDGRILRGISEDFREYQAKAKPRLSVIPEKDMAEVTIKKKEKKPNEPLLSTSLTGEQKLREPVIQEAEEVAENVMKKEEIRSEVLLSQSHSEEEKPKKPKQLLKTSVSEAQENSEHTSIDEETKALLHKEESTRGHLYILGNILLGVISLGIVHAIFYLGSLIAYGAQIQKWESQDPITWFFHRIKANIVFQKNADVVGEGLSVEESSYGF